MWYALTFLLFQIITKPIVKITKDGKDNLVVDNMDLFMQDAKHVETKFACGGAKLDGECKRQPCTYTFDCNTVGLTSGNPSLIKGGRRPNLQPKNLKIATMTAKIGADGTG